MVVTMLLAVMATSFNIIIAVDPVVQLGHGGYLQGRKQQFGDSYVDAYLGVRYAKAPIGNLRFRRPIEADRWRGTVAANQTGNDCVQYTIDLSVIGNEDCLFLDIYTPTGFSNIADQSERKAVMVWIHGGGYILGAGRSFVGAPLAITGDVIVVSINYRLGPLGFLSDGMGTGNFGLWDQRAAMVWVKKNIAAFGGDPSRVTIFGESAGGGSVSALLMGKSNDGLFHRAIQQSGSLYQPWSWYQTKPQLQGIVDTVRQNTNCTLALTAYDCLAGLSSTEVLAVTQYADTPFDAKWGPTEDNSFFPADIAVENYSATQKYDLLAGFNGQEGAFLISFELAFNPTNLSGPGVDMKFAEEHILELCKMGVNPLSPDLCQKFLIDTYRIRHSRTDVERAIRLSYAAGEINFNSDIVRQLQKHSEGSRSTYAYYYTQLANTPAALLGPPLEWLRVSADHGEEIPIVWGWPLIANQTNKFWTDIPAGSPMYPTQIPPAIRSEINFSNLVMTMWTNFAKSGNPNSPAPLPWGTPYWPEYRENNDLFMELHSTLMRVVRTPHKYRLDDLRRYILKARQQQYVAVNEAC